MATVNSMNTGDESEDWKLSPAGDLLQDIAELCLSIYEGNLLLYRIAKDQSQLDRMNHQLKEAVGRS